VGLKKRCAARHSRLLHIPSGVLEMHLYSVSWINQHKIADLVQLAKSKICFKRGFNRA